MEAMVAAPTVRSVLPLWPPKVAVMVVVPGATALASPPGAMVAVAVVPEVQTAELVTSWAGPEVKLAVAMNCCVVPLAIVGLPGVTTTEMTVALVTVRVALPDTAPTAAEMAVCPGSTEVASPVPSTVAVAGVPDIQLAVAVTSRMLASLKVAIAVNCWVVPSAMAGVPGVTAMDTIVAAPTVRSVLPLCPSKVAVMVVVPGATALASPPGAMVAKPVWEEVHTALLVTS